jgi:hypothetical protein
MSSANHCYDKPVLLVLLKFCMCWQNALQTPQETLEFISFITNVRHFESKNIICLAMTVAFNTEHIFVYRTTNKIPKI